MGTGPGDATEYLRLPVLAQGIHIHCGDGGPAVEFDNGFHYR